VKRQPKQFISQEHSAEMGGKNLKEGTRKSRTATYLTTAFFSFTIVIGLFLISFTIVFFFSEVKGPSMMRAINATDEMDTDSVIVNRYKKPVRGDIIVVKHHDGKLHIKRLIALGGESIHMQLLDKDGNRISPKTETEFRQHGVRYVFEVDGISYDNILYKLDPILGRNMRNERYDLLYKYQQGIITRAEFITRQKSLSSGLGNFRTEDRHGTEFRQRNSDRERYEFKLPADYIFYMGDNRGGDGFYRDHNNTTHGSAPDFQNLSLDSTWFGPQPTSNLVGTVTEVIHDKSAPQWFWDQVVWFFSLRWI
jgi:signal peptidase I